MAQSLMQCLVFSREVSVDSVNFRRVNEISLMVLPGIGVVEKADRFPLTTVLYCISVVSRCNAYYCSSRVLYCLLLP